MDNGTAIFLASLTGPASLLVSTLWNRYETRAVAKTLATQLAVHNEDIAKELAANTALTQETKDKTERTYEEMNGMKDALIEAAEAKGLAQGKVDEKARADKERKR